MTLEQWAIRWGVPHAALAELRADMGHDDPGVTDPGHGEAYVQSTVRLACSRAGWRVWRNNVGAGTVQESGSFLRWGLANDSERMNRAVKSADLIGVRPLTVTPDLVGSIVGQFVSLECKPGGWRFTGTPREIAQDRWAQIIRALGGRARFTTGAIE